MAFFRCSNGHGTAKFEEVGDGVANCQVGGPVETDVTKILPLPLLLGRQ